MLLNIGIANIVIQRNGNNKVKTVDSTDGAKNEKKDWRTEQRKRVKRS